MRFFEGKNRISAFRCFLALCSGVFLSGSATQAGLIVDWGGNYVANDQTFSGSWTNESGLDLDGDSNTDDSRFGYAFSDSSPLSPSVGYSGTSDTFYGGFVVNALDTGGPDTLSDADKAVHRNGLTDHIHFHTQHSGNHHHTFALAILWDKADFLSAGDSYPVSLDAASNLSISVRNNSNLEPDAHLHFLIRDGSQLYASEAFWGGVSPSTLEPGYQGAFPDRSTAVLNPVLSSLNWQVYNPSGLDLQFSHGPYVTPSFSDITAVGFYVDTLNFTDGPSNNSHLEIEDFSVNAFVAVPEPSTFLGLFGLVIGLAICRRRRKLC